MSESSIVVAPTTSRAILTSEALKAESEQRTLLARYVKQQMVEGTDYGTIPGTPKPTLLKPGAEKLVDLFRCTPKFALVKIEEDHEKGFFNYVFRVRLYQRDAGAVLAEGFGSCNSREGRYRWREAQRKCPRCTKATIFASKHEPGFYCWAKKGGCGAKYAPEDASITGQQAGKVENDDIATMANTILKMAKKRALVDGAIALARCSDMFTQDVEDFADAEAATPPPSPAPNARTEALKEKLRQGHSVVASPAEVKAASEALKAEGKAEPSQGLAGQLEESVEVMRQLSQMAGHYGFAGAKMASIIKGATGKSNRNQLTLDDVEKIRASIEATIPRANH